PASERRFLPQDVPQTGSLPPVPVPARSPTEFLRLPAQERSPPAVPPGFEPPFPPPPPRHPPGFQRAPPPGNSGRYAGRNSAGSAPNEWLRSAQGSFRSVLRSPRSASRLLKLIPKAPVPLLGFRTDHVHNVAGVHFRSEE